MERTSRSWVMCLILAVVAFCSGGCMTLIVGLPTQMKTDGMARKAIDATYRQDATGLGELGMSADGARAAIKGAGGRLGSGDAHFIFDSLVADSYFRQYRVRRSQPSAMDRSTDLEIRVWFKDHDNPRITSIQYLGPEDDVPTTRPTQDSPLQPNRLAGQNTVIWTGKVWPYEICWADTSDRAVVAVYVFGRGGAEGKGVLPWLVAAVWSDGRIVASADHLEGGRPYLKGNLGAEAAERLVRTLTGLARESGVLSTIKPGPPDYAKTFIQFRTKDGHVYQLGWCEELLGEGELKDGQLGEGERSFRKVWAELRRAIDEAIPKKMEPAREGAVRFEVVKRG